MTTAHVASATPKLDFGDFGVSFPARCAHAFLALDDLQAPDDLRELHVRGPQTDDVGIWLLRSKSGASIILPVVVPVVRNKYRVVDLAVLHHGDALEFAGHDVIFREIEEITLGPKNRATGHRCPQCHSPHRDGALVVSCPFCGEAYCDDCWRHLNGRRCFSRGCRFAPCPVSTDDA
jgi:hypothetical protein